MRLSELTALFPGQDPVVMAWDERMESPTSAILVEHRVEGFLCDEHGNPLPYVVIAIDDDEDEEN